MSSLAGQTVRRRRVFYIPGYDPFHPRRYRELYRSESIAQAAISGYDIVLSPKSGGDRYGWLVESKIDEAETSAEFDVLGWSDIVKDSMAQGILSTYFQLLRTAWIYIASGALRRLMRLRKGPVIAALYPVGFLLIQLVLSVALGLVVFYGFLRLWSAAVCGEGCVIPKYLEVSLIIGGLLGSAATWAAMLWFKRKDNKFFAYYLMHDYAYSAQHDGANPPQLAARMSEFSDEIAKALSENWDEVLIVGHSSGAHLAVMILSDIIRNEKVPLKGPKLSFLSLGQVVPMVSFLPKAHQLRADLQFLSARKELTWVDVTAPGDGCAFALCDPVSVSGVAPSGKLWPLVISAAFTQTLSPERWRALRWRFFRLHFQYLCAFDKPADYDYFQITAGPMMLKQRYSGRAPSPSRIEAATSGYTSMAA